MRPERRRQFHRDLVGSVQDAFDLLRSCLNEGAPDLHEQVQYHANESVQNIVPIENILVTFTNFVRHLEYLIEKFTFANLDSGVLLAGTPCICSLDAS